MEVPTGCNSAISFLTFSTVTLTHINDTHEKYYGDEYESDDFEKADTLIGRNRAPIPKKKPRPVTPNKSPNKAKKVTKKKRAQSAPTARSGHELWMNAVKSGLTVGLASNRRPQSPRHKTAGEYWIDTLRKTGQGFSTESTGMNTFSGRRPRDKDMPYLSTPSYLRQLVGTEKPPKGGDPTAKAAPGTPAYKSQEEYYDQILEYKKQVSNLNQDVSTMRAKIRRLEEDNLKKEKEIDCLLHPEKSEELRRTLADRRPDSGSVIHSLKQKILKLETQLRDKETAFIKLQSDLKTTKVEEIKQQMEVFYQEIVRLQNSKETGMDRSHSSPSKDSSGRLKALNETIIRLNKTNEQLQSENKSLKEDLKNALDEGGGKSSTKDYEDMNRKELLRVVAKLEKRADRAERQLDTSSMISYDSKATRIPGKLALEGSLADRLDQLDKRESELLEALEKKNTQIKQLSEEKHRWKRRCDEMESMLKEGGRSYVEETPRRVSTTANRPPSSRPLSARSRDTRPLSARSDTDRQLSARDGRSSADRDRPTSAGRDSRTSSSDRRPGTADRRPTSSDRRPSSSDRRPSSSDRRLGSTDRRPSSAKRRDSMESSMSAARRQRIEQFRENKSAKTIQRQWRSHQQTKAQKQNERVERFQQERAAKKIQKGWTGYKYRKNQEETEEASDLIRSALMGHSLRQQQLRKYQNFSDDDETEDEEYNECADLIRSAMLGHQNRKSRVQNFRYSDEDDDDDDDDIIQTPKRRSISNRPQSPSVYRSSNSGRQQRPSSSRISSGSIRSTTTYNRSNTNSVYDDDDDF